MERGEPYYDNFRFLLSFTASITLSYPTRSVHGIWGFKTILPEYIPYIFHNHITSFFSCYWRYTYVDTVACQTAHYHQQLSVELKFSRFNSVTCFGNNLFSDSRMSIF